MVGDNQIRIDVVGVKKLVKTLDWLVVIGMLIGLGVCAVFIVHDVDQLDSYGLRLDAAIRDHCELKRGYERDSTDYTACSISFVEGVHWERTGELLFPPAK